MHTAEMADVYTPLADEISGNFLRDGEAEEIGHLCRENRKGYACRKAYHDWIRNEFDYRA